MFPHQFHISFTLQSSHQRESKVQKWKRQKGNFKEGEKNLPPWLAHPTYPTLGILPLAVTIPDFANSVASVPAKIPPPILAAAPSAPSPPFPSTTT
jgi:hypothetical protein